MRRNCKSTQALVLDISKLCVIGLVFEACVFDFFTVPAFLYKA